MKPIMVNNYHDNNLFDNEWCSLLLAFLCSQLYNFGSMCVELALLLKYWAQPTTATSTINCFTSVRTQMWNSGTVVVWWACSGVAAGTEASMCAVMTACELWLIGACCTQTCFSVPYVTAVTNGWLRTMTSSSSVKMTWNIRVLSAIHLCALTAICEFTAFSNACTPLSVQYGVGRTDTSADTCTCVLIQNVVWRALNLWAFTSAIHFVEISRSSTRLLKTLTGTLWPTEGVVWSAITRDLAASTVSLEVLKSRLCHNLVFTLFPLAEGVLV